MVAKGIQKRHEKDSARGDRIRGLFSSSRRHPGIREKTGRRPGDPVDRVKIKGKVTG